MTAPSPAAAGLPEEDVERVETDARAAETDRLDPVCSDCEDHGDGSYTCDPERSACPHARRQQGNDALKQRAKALLAPARAEMDSLRAALGTGDREGGR